MKRRRIPAYAMAALGLLVCLGSCTAEPTDTPGQTPSDEDDTHLETIATLEATLQKEREERYISESRLKNEIQSLEQHISMLLGTRPEASPAPEALTFHYRVENGKAIITGYEGDAALLNIPETLDGYAVVGIGERAFEHSAVVAVVLPEGVESIGWFAFYGCSSLCSVTLPASINTIGYAVFDGCSSISVVCPTGSYAERYAKSYGIYCTAS